MKRSKAEWAISKSGLPPSQRLLFRTLLGRADNKDCAVPSWLTPSIEDLIDSTGMPRSGVCAGLNHLEMHGWLSRSRTTGGRGRKTTYHLIPTATTPCDCTKQSKKSTRNSPKEQSKWPVSLPRSDPTLHEGTQQGKGVVGEGSEEVEEVESAWPEARRPSERVLETGTLSDPPSDHSLRYPPDSTNPWYQTPEERWKLIAPLYDD